MTTPAHPYLPFYTARQIAATPAHTASGPSNHYDQAPKTMNRPPAQQDSWEVPWEVQAEVEIETRPNFTSHHRIDSVSKLGSWGAQPYFHAVALGGASRGRLVGD